jgi:NAD-dependent dihydropyrimidine dehydrogenase PreA subunit
VGFVIDLPVFHAMAPNITPNNDTGIGTWIDEQIGNATRTGKRLDGATISPPMPIGFYRNKREEDSIAPIGRDKCRGWGICVSACPYKIMYFNWESGKAERCTFCVPRSARHASSAWHSRERQRRWCSDHAGVDRRLSAVVSRRCKLAGDRAYDQLLAQEVILPIDLARERCGGTPRLPGRDNCSVH